MTILFTLVNVFLVAFVSHWVWKRLNKEEAFVYWSALAVRLISGILVGLLYMYYYEGGDTFELFNDSLALAKGDFELITTEPRSLFFIYIVHVINFVTHSNYWLTSLWFSLFSFICSYRLVRKLDEIFPLLKVASRIALLFLPSVIFWSSGIVKETLAFGAVAILSLYFLAFMNNEKLNWKSFIEIILALVLLLTLKYYWAAVLIPSMITAIIIKRINPKKFLFTWYLMVFVMFCLGASLTHPNFYLSRFLYVLVGNHDIYIVRIPDNLIHYYSLTPEWNSILLNSPLALWSGLFRPTVLEISSFPEALAALENLAILILFIWKFLSLKLPTTKNRLIVLTVIVYIIVVCIFLAISTPNLGSLSRYRVGFLSFFVLLILADHPILKFIHGKSSNHIRS